MTIPTAHIQYPVTRQNVVVGASLDPKYSDARELPAVPGLLSTDKDIKHVQVYTQLPEIDEIIDGKPTKFVMEEVRPGYMRMNAINLAEVQVDSDNKVLPGSYSIEYDFDKQNIKVDGHHFADMYPVRNNSGGKMVPFAPISSRVNNQEFQPGLVVPSYLNLARMLHSFAAVGIVILKTSQMFDHVMSGGSWGSGHIVGIMYIGTMFSAQKMINNFYYDSRAVVVPALASAFEGIDKLIRNTLSVFKGRRGDNLILRHYTEGFNVTEDELRYGMGIVVSVHVPLNNVEFSQGVDVHLLE
jgi:hypothetical protein